MIHIGRKPNKVNYERLLSEDWTFLMHAVKQHQPPSNYSEPKQRKFICAKTRVLKKLEVLRKKGQLK